MLRVHIVQLCYNLSDPDMDDLLYEAEPVRRFAGLRLPEPIPDESAVLHFRHLLERHQLGQGLFEEVKGYLEERGYGSGREPSWTPPSLRRRHPPRTVLGSGTQRCDR